MCALNARACLGALRSRRPRGPRGQSRGLPSPCPALSAQRCRAERSSPAASRADALAEGGYTFHGRDLARPRSSHKLTWWEPEAELAPAMRGSRALQDGVACDSLQPSADASAETTQKRVRYVCGFRCFSGFWHWQGQLSEVRGEPLDKELVHSTVALALPWLLIPPAHPLNDGLRMQRGGICSPEHPSI